MSAAEPWDDLADDELAARLTHRGVDAATARDLLVPNRDDETVAGIIEVVLGGG